MDELKEAWSGTPSLRALYRLVWFGFMGLAVGVFMCFFDQVWAIPVAIAGGAVVLIALVVGTVLQVRQTRRSRAADPEWTPPTRTQRAQSVFIWSACAPAMVWLGVGFTAAKHGDELEGFPFVIPWVATALALLVAGCAGLLWRRWALESRQT